MKKKNFPRYLFVVGGVISGVGKGITVSSIGKILKDRGLKVTAIKIDPYVNVDAGTMNPTEHGEVFVLHDGYETDQDMGNYERFMGLSLSRDNYMTTGMVYKSVIDDERALKYKGKCVQVVPHIPQEIVRRIKNAEKKAKADVTIVEIGGTVGEYENILYLEAARMMKLEKPGSVFVAMVSYLPVPAKIGEMKTKPTQHAVRLLNSSGLQPDVIFARSVVRLDEKRKEKLEMFCNMQKGTVISAPDVESVYDIPINFEKEKVGDLLCKIMGLKKKKESKEKKEWESFVRKVKNAKDELKIAIVGKYFDTGDFTLSDSYLSVIESLKYSIYHAGKKPAITWVNAIDFENDKNKVKVLKNYDGVLVPGGFGSRGVLGKLTAIKYARENKIPYFGLCYGMQLLVIEYARNVLGWSDASTTEINKNTKYPVIDIMPEQIDKLAKKNYGNTMRLGDYTAYIKEGTLAHSSYKSAVVNERHRHRYEVNPEFVQKLEEAGLVFSGKSKDGKLCEIAELPTKVHPFFLGTQFHPEFLGKPLSPHPLFTAFVKASISRKGKK